MSKFLNKATAIFLALAVILTSVVLPSASVQAAVTIPDYSETDAVYVNDYINEVPVIKDLKGNVVTKHEDFVLGELYTMADHTWMAIADRADENYIILQCIDLGLALDATQLYPTQMVNNGYIGDISARLYPIYDKLLSIEKITNNKIAYPTGSVYFDGLYLPSPGSPVIKTEQELYFSEKAMDMAIEYCIDNNVDFYHENYSYQSNGQMVYRTEAFAWNFYARNPYLYKTHKKTFTFANSAQDSIKCVVAPCFNLDTTRLQFSESTDIKVRNTIENNWTEIASRNDFYLKFIDKGSINKKGFYAGYDNYDLKDCFAIEYADGSNKRRRINPYNVTTDSEYCYIKNGKLIIPDAAETHTATLTFTTDNNFTKTYEIEILPNVTGVQAASTKKLKSGSKVNVRDFITAEYKEVGNKKSKAFPEVTNDIFAINKDDYIISVKTADGGIIDSEGNYKAPRVNEAKNITLTLTDTKFGYTTDFTVTIEAKDVRKDSVASTEYHEYSDNGDCEVLTSIASTFIVTIPKKIVLSGSSKTGSYIVNVKGDIAGNELVEVTPDASFTLKEKGGKSDVTAAVIQERTAFAYSDINTEAGHSENGSVSAPITAGTWSGRFDFLIELSFK